jgi:SHO1 osmosensor
MFSCLVVDVLVFFSSFSSFRYRRFCVAFWSSVDI